MKLDVLNGDGYKNVAPSGIVSDSFRPGNSELSNYLGFNTELKLDFSKLGQMQSGLMSGSPTPGSNPGNAPGTDNYAFTNLLQNALLADITNNAINARTFTNIDPLVLDLNGDGVKLTSYNDSDVTFDVDEAPKPGTTLESLAKLKEALAGDDNDAVKAAMDDLNTKASAMGQAMYAAAQAKQQADEAEAPTAGAEDASSSPADDDVVDAEIVDDEDNDKK